MTFIAMNVFRKALQGTKVRKIAVIYGHGPASSVKQAVMESSYGDECNRSHSSSYYEVSCFEGLHEEGMGVELLLHEKNCKMPLLACCGAEPSSHM